MAQFPSTQWSLIRRSGDSPSQRHAAFGQLAQGYRRAILAFFRARLPAADAEDATQSFLASSFEHSWWSRANAEVGSFRSFLLMLLHRHLGHVLAAQRHGVDDPDAVDAAHDPSPSAEQQFDTRFALVLTTRAIDMLRTRYGERLRPRARRARPVRCCEEGPARSLGDRAEFRARGDQRDRGRRSGDRAAHCVERSRA